MTPESATGRAAAPRRFVLALSCPDSSGIVARISGALADLGGWIVEAGYHSDPDSGRFFTRQVITTEPDGPGLTRLREQFAAVATELGADQWRVVDTTVRKKIVVLVGTEGHCLYELLSRWHAGALGADIELVVSNHDTLEPVAELFSVPFRQVPMVGAAVEKDRAFAEVGALVEAVEPDAVVLARFMQVVPPRWCQAWSGRLINIHHGFLPSFSGARPYQQAHRRGVKLVGATCHYVTSELDAGPIIDQDVIRVDHTETAAAMARRGRDIEKAVLARGLDYHLADRVLLDGQRTIVFG